MKRERAFRRMSVREFRVADTEELSKYLVGALVRTGFEGDLATLQSYEESIVILQRSFKGIEAIVPSALDWTIFLEFQLPRRQKRLDAVVLAGDRIVIAEFKTGNQGGEKSARIQVEDYALDLRDFHETSHRRFLIPVVVSSRKGFEPLNLTINLENRIANTIVCRPDDLSLFWSSVAGIDHPFDKEAIDAVAWEEGSYSPVPPIIEAALQLYRTHQVRDIAACAAGDENLTHTVEAIREVIMEALASEKHVVCFVTGVPGSGKTLAGLTSVHMADNGESQNPQATFLSGNMPLVRVLRAALVSDSRDRLGRPKKEIEREVGTFVESIHAFIDEHWTKDPKKAPHNNVIVFDESQRAWDRRQMHKKQQIDRSEPELLLEIMARHKAAVIIALVGGGQEIHQGEAGLRGWGEAIEADGRWTVSASPEVIDGSVSMAGSRLFEGVPPATIGIVSHDDLHLRVPRRTIRETCWNDWVEAFLAADFGEAGRISKNLDGFTAYVTRDLSHARRWLRSRTKGTRRSGIVSSSGNLRARFFGIEVSSSFRKGIDWTAWFLMNKGDVRSSSYLDVSASEFECQGLEIDEAALCWGGDMHFAEGSDSWAFFAFKGKNWTNVKNASDQKYIQSKYRVLLTRARSGLVIWVPPAVEHDPTIKGQEFDRLYSALVQSGLSPLPHS